MRTYVRSKLVVSRVIAGETLIVPIRRGVGDLASIYSLNAVGSRVWDVIADPRSADEVTLALEQEYAGNSQVIGSDVQTFLDELSSAGLVLESGAAA
jgi:hypothetical protein